MPFMCDALLPEVERAASLKYRRLSYRYNPWVAEGGDNIEVQAMLMTPGLAKLHVFALMRWDRHMHDHVHVLAQLADKAQGLAAANAEAVTLDDGHAMLRTILGNFPDWAESVPLWATRYLQDQRRRGWTAPMLAREWHTTPERVMRWWSADMFDPLTGVLRPRAERWRNKKVKTARYRATI